MDTPVITTYYRNEEFRAAIESATQQTHTDIEILSIPLIITPNQLITNNNQQ